MSKPPFHTLRPCVSLPSHSRGGTTYLTKRPNSQQVENIWGPPTSTDESCTRRAAPVNEVITFPCPSEITAFPCPSEITVSSSPSETTVPPRPSETAEETLQYNHHNYIKNTSDCMHEAANSIANMHSYLNQLHASVEDAGRRGVAISTQEWVALGMLKTQLVGLCGQLDDGIRTLESMDTKVRVSPCAAPPRRDGWVSVTGGRPPPGLSVGGSRASTVSTAGTSEFLGSPPPGLGDARVQRADYGSAEQREALRNIWESPSRPAEQPPRNTRQY